MRRWSTLTATILSLAVTGGLRADGKDTKKTDDNAVAKAMSKIVELGPGVHNIKTDAKGRITRCLVVGQARISTVLGKAKGLETARQRAQLAARAEFVKWLKDNVSVHEKTEDEQILFLEGSEKNDEEALKESGKAVEKTSQRMESCARSLVRGLQIIHTAVNAKDKTYTVVYGWDAKTSEATKQARKDLNEDSPSGTGPDADANDGGKGSGSKKPLDKKIEDKNATSKDAKKFIDD